MENCTCTKDKLNCPYHKNLTERDRLRDIILDEVDQVFNEFIFYARKLDKRLPLKEIEESIISGIITEEEITNHFKQNLESVVSLVRLKKNNRLLKDAGDK